MNCAIFIVLFMSTTLEYTEATEGCQKGTGKGKEYKDGTVKESSVLAINTTKTLTVNRDQVCVFNLCNMHQLTIDQLTVSAPSGLACQDGGAGYHPFFFTLYKAQPMNVHAEIYVTFMSGSKSINDPSSILCADDRQGIHVCVFNLCNMHQLTIGQLTVSAPSGLACQDGGAGYHPFLPCLYKAQPMTVETEIYVTYMSGSKSINDPSFNQGLDDYCN